MTNLEALKELYVSMGGKPEDVADLTLLADVIAKLKGVAKNNEPLIVNITYNEQTEMFETDTPQTRIWQAEENNERILLNDISNQRMLGVSTVEYLDGEKKIFSTPVTSSAVSSTVEYKFYIINLDDGVEENAVAALESYTIRKA